MIFLGAITKQTPSHDLHVRHRQLKGSARDVCMRDCKSAVPERDIILF